MANWLKRIIEATNKANGTSLSVDSSEAEVVDHFESQETATENKTVETEKGTTSEDIQSMINDSVKANLVELNIAESISEAVNKTTGKQIEDLTEVVASLTSKVESNHTAALTAVNDAKLSTVESGKGNEVPAVGETKKDAEGRKVLEIKGSMNDLVNGRLLGGL